MTDQIKQQNEIQQGLLEIIQDLRSGNSQLGAPRKSTDVEFVIESLANGMTEFAYDNESTITFENWYNRYSDIFEDETKKIER